MQASRWDYLIRYVGIIFTLGLSDLLYRVKGMYICIVSRACNHAMPMPLRYAYVCLCHCVMLMYVWVLRYTYVCLGVVNLGDVNLLTRLEVKMCG